MSLGSTEAVQAMPPAWWLRLHQSLMPDYNRKATVYWWVVVLLGAAILAYALHLLLSLPMTDLVQVLVGVAIAVLAGVFPVRIPGSKISFAAGETFIFLLLLLHGPEAAALAAAGEGLVGSWRTSKRWTSRIASPAMACIAMFSVGSVQQAIINALQAWGQHNAGLLLTVTMLCSLLYFVLNTLLVTATGNLKRNQWPVWRDIFGSFGWVGVTFAASASLACLIFLSAKQSGTGVLFAAVPIIVMLLITLHYFFRQQETAVVLQQDRLRAAEQETKLAADHMAELKLSEQRFHSAFTHASLGMALVAADGRVVKANLALHTLLGMEGETAFEQRPFNSLVGSDEVASINDHLLRLKLRHVSSFTVVLRLRHELGIDVWASVHGSVFSESDSASPVMILQMQDITSRRKAEADLQHIAFHDSLTGLPNRRRFREELTLALDRLKNGRPRHFSLMFLDVDRFKMINDSLGHAVGDELLISVARGIQNQLRPHDIVARLGGDEFAILAEDLNSHEYAVSLADRLVKTLRMPFQIGGADISTSVSIGITFSIMGYEAVEDMLRDADTAMYKAKAAGKSRYALFDSSLHSEVSSRLQMESDLRNALRDGQLSVAYQPLFELSSGDVVGFEALARWNHPDLGAVPPDRFIPVAEEAGLILEITDFMLHSACKQLKAWQLRNPLFHDLYVNVNLSGRDIVQPGLVGRVTAALVASQLKPRCLTLELTESILMSHLEAALPVLVELRRLDIGLSVDDFGTGYSSLKHLSALPVTSMKIDRGFVLNLEHGLEDAAVVQAIVSLGRSLSKCVCAEGIESAAQMEQLRGMGCSLGQGFHLSRPLSAEMIEQMLDGLVADPMSAHAAFALTRSKPAGYPLRKVG